MLTPDQITALRDRAFQITDPINDYLLEDIARRISEAGQLTSTAAYQVWRAQQLGLSRQEIRKRLQKLLRASRQEIRQLLTQSAEAGYNFDISRLPSVQAVPFQQNTVLQQIVSAAVELAQEDFTNLTQTLGMVDPYGNVQPLQAAYRACTDFAFKQVVTGAADYSTAIRQATRNLAAKGVRVIDYGSGVHTSLEAAVRRNIMGGLGLMQEKISQVSHDALGCDGWEITAHANSAPDHEPIQGRQYSDAAYEALNNSLIRRIGTLNCGHAAFPIILGVNSPQYTPEELEKLRADNEKGVTVGGKHYTGYEATQMQRKLERAIRNQKRRVMIDEAAGDAEKKQLDQIKLQGLNQEYVRFSKAAKLKTQHERTEVAGFKAARQEVTPISRAKAVEISQKPATMKENGTSSEGTSVKTIGKIDVEKYCVVSDQIRTDEVVITEERIQHIRDHHPNDYERYSQYIAEMLENPQYILEDKVPNTAVILKEFAGADERFRLILRLAVLGDAPGKKNSIITFLKISEKKFNKYLRNKNILYKSE